MSGSSVLVFDGDCGFCTSAAEWAARRFTDGERAVAWQQLSETELESLGLSRDQVANAAWWVRADGGLERGHRAVGMALRAGGGWRRLPAFVMLTPPTNLVAGAVYGLVVKYRYKLPGGTAACQPGATTSKDTSHP